MRERWFGATGRKVPEIALEGTIDLEAGWFLAIVAAATGVVLLASGMGARRG